MLILITMKVAYLKKAAPEGSVELLHDIFYVVDAGTGFFRRVYWEENGRGVWRGELEPLSDQVTLGQVKAIVENGKTEVGPLYSSLRVFEYDGEDITEIVKEIQEWKKRGSSETTRRFIRHTESL